MNAKTTGGGKGFRTPLSAASAAQGLIAQARRLEAMQAAVAGQLPVELAAGWQLARLDDEAMVIVTDSPARATRLRYARSALLRAARTCSGIQPKSLQVKLAPPAAEAKKPQRAELSPTAAAYLQQAAKGMEEGELRRALAKLARRAKRRD